MEAFAEYLEGIDHPEHRARMEEVLSWTAETFPNLTPKIAWNQPMFTDHGTFIIGFSTAKHHLAVAPESAGIDRFTEEIVQAGYDHTKQLVRFFNERTPLFLRFFISAKKLNSPPYPQY